MHIFPVLILLLFLTVGCKKEEVKPANSTPEPVETDETFSYLALGDSYTIGQSVAASERYPVQLAEALSEKGIAMQAPEIIATTGWTTADLQNAIALAKLEGKEYDLVSLLIGVNNQYQGRSVEEYAQEFKELLLQAIELAGNDTEKVFVLSIPDYGYTPFGASRQESISQDIDRFNAINKEITTELGVQYFDITPISRKGLADPELVAGDGLHPSGKMYRQWTDLITETVAKMLLEP